MEDDIASINKKKQLSLFMVQKTSYCCAIGIMNCLMHVDVTDFGCEDVREIGKILQRSSHSLKSVYLQFIDFWSNQ